MLRNGAFDKVPPKQILSELRFNARININVIEII